EYFCKQWMDVEVVKMWSAMFRTTRSIFQDVDTNMLVEAYVLLLSMFLHGKQNRRMDHLIHVL
ncbi:hypothetical protein C8F01DRAFT_939667, partial [Mycena amicta]